MQIKFLVSGNTFSTISTGSNSATTAYNPISSTVGLLVLSINQTTTGTYVAGSGSIELQGSVNGTEWYTLHSVTSSAFKASAANGADLGTNTGQRNYTQMVQTMPYLRMASAGTLNTGGAAANTFLRAMILNG